MIKSISDLLNAMITFESKELDIQKIKHAPTIGAMYEGLTKSVLEKIIPTKLPLSVVSGFVEGADKTLSQQIDCMLVVGTGRAVPYTPSFIFPIEQVIAVVEVKKSLYEAGIVDGFDNLKSVAKLKSADTAKVPRIFGKAFESITQCPLPKNPADLPEELRMIYYVLLMEAVKPTRILLGYHGDKTEDAVRASVLKFAEESVGKKGFGPGSYPNLIVNQHVAVIKANGMPWGNKLEDGWWQLLLTGGPNTPMHSFLEIIWSRLNFLGMIGASIFGEDLEIDVWHKLLAVRPKSVNGEFGWEAQPYVAQVPKSDAPRTVPWIPSEITDDQSVIIAYLGKKGTIDLNNLIDGFETHPDLPGTIRKLQDMGLVGEDRTSPGKYSLLTQECGVGILPDGRIFAGDNMSGQLTRWLVKQAQIKKGA